MKLGPAYSWVEISRRALIANIRVHRRMVGKKVKLMAVVKSNAYGHGIELVSQVAASTRQVDWLGVASLEEAKLIRQAKVKLPILVLSFFRPFVMADLIWAIKHSIAFMVYETEQLKILSLAAQKAKKPAKIHLKLETGMARLGLFPKEARIFLEKILKSPRLQLEGIASHFATAESRDQKFLKKQLSAYRRFTKSVSGKLPNSILHHISCSAAITTAPTANLSLVRLGIALYGLWPSDENKQVVHKMNSEFKLQPALTWKTQIIEVQHLPKNTPVGYDRTFVTKKSTTIVALPIGYWDGLDRGLSNKGRVIIKGVICPIIGRICMNITMVDASAVRNVKVGDEVILIGKKGRGEVTADKIARLTQTINYEVVTRINPLLPRHLV
ncbi:MAG TPA: alanine racemase [Candidatus Veblenbacteria bacterium]|nr:MAG: alanine racemase [Parcubacteria group bacterium GW2011_GWE2_43_12]HBZ36668.1 alanine racemase [Candidatus Veblenbacteria bacterium]